jgi:hypothetical protein
MEFDSSRLVRHFKWNYGKGVIGIKMNDDPEDEGWSRG